MQGNRELNTMYDDTCIKVYDPEQKKLIGVFKSYIKAANRLGITGTRVQQKCASKNRVFSPVLQKHVALRLSAVKPEDIPLIEKNQILK